MLNAKGLAYPSGHCPQLKLSGYLLGGGMSWNQGVWGYGNESVEAIELVTAEGKLITANERDYSDYFWTARGAGYGFFGVVTRYHLKLYPLPKAIHGVTYYYSLSDAPAVAEWLGNIASKLSPAIELSLLPHITGYYIGETDPVAVPSEATGAFSPESGKRLAHLRDKYDPDGVFFGYLTVLPRVLRCPGWMVSFRKRGLNRWLDFAES